MTKYLSSKLTVLYTVLIIMVVYIHSYYLEAEYYTFAVNLQKFIGNGICRIANCLFFCISGYLFARNINSSKDVWTKLKKRWKTLVPPYILWNIIFVLWYVVLAITPGVSRFNNSGGILESYQNQPFYDTLYDMFIDPAAFQLWFLRDLLVMLLFTPVLFWITRKSWVVAMVLALCSTAVYAWLVYFWLGIIIAMQRWNIEKYSRPKWLITSGMILFIGYAVYLVCGNHGTVLLGLSINVIGLYLVWAIYDIFAQGKCLADKGIWKYICGYSFFIYCFHEPAFNIIKKLPLAIFGTSEPVLVFFYLINPWIMVGLAVITAKLLQRMAPQIYRTLTGGR